MIPENNKEAREEEQQGTTEDPAVNLTEQNRQGDAAAGSTEINVPKEALDNYKQNGRDTDE